MDHWKNKRVPEKYLFLLNLLFKAREKEENSLYYKLVMKGTDGRTVWNGLFSLGDRGPVQLLVQDFGFSLKNWSLSASLRVGLQKSTASGLSFVIHVSKSGCESTALTGSSRYVRSSMRDTAKPHLCHPYTWCLPDFCHLQFWRAAVFVIIIPGWTRSLENPHRWMLIHKLMTS